MKAATIMYIIPKTRATSPVHLFPKVLLAIAIIPAIIRNIPAINTNKAATKLNSAGLNTKPRPKINAKNPKMSSAMPITALSPIAAAPINRRPKPKNSTATPVSTLNGITPKSGNAKTIKPKTMRIIAFPVFSILITS